LGRQDWEDKIGKTRLGRQDWEDKIDRIDYIWGWGWGWGDWKGKIEKIGKTRLIGLIIFEVKVKVKVEVKVEVEEIEKARLRRLGRQDW